MTTLLAGFVLGALGALAHLACVWWRARLITSGRPGHGLAIYPVGLAGPGLAVLAALELAAPAAWAALAGIVALRSLFVGSRREARA